MYALIGQKPMFHQSIKVSFIVYTTLPLYHKANEEAFAMYYTPDIWEHLRNVKNTRLWLVFSTFPLCS